MFKRLISSGPLLIDCALLLVRIGTGCFMLTHGWPKLAGFSERASKFADPFGIGSEASLALAVFAEFFCSILVILGLFTRFALIPLIITMLVVVLDVHINDPFAQQEKALLYLLLLITIFLLGSGRYSADRLIFRN